MVQSHTPFAPAGGMFLEMKGRVTVPSTDEDDAFDEIAERELADIRAKAIFANQAPISAFSCLFLLIGAVRMVLAAYGIIVLHNLAVTIAASVLFGGYLLGLVYETIKAAKEGRRQRHLPAVEHVDNLKRMASTVHPAQKWRRFFILIRAIITSILAGIGVAHLSNAPTGIIVGLAFFAVVAVTLAKNRWILERTMRPLNMITDQPRNTPET
jgi:hypothetical protein